jgi:hypothetical protein
MNKHMDFGSLMVALITLALFLAALFTKGINHDLFLEAGVFLVSVKIIVMAYKNGVAVGHLSEKLDKILAELARNDQGADGAGGSRGRSKPKE